MHTVDDVMYYVMHRFLLMFMFNVFILCITCVYYHLTIFWCLFDGNSTMTTDSSENNGAITLPHMTVSDYVYDTSNYLLFAV